MGIVGSNEQRVTGFGIHAIIASSIIFLRPVLKQVPLAVLMGLFMFLGTSALKGNEMWERTVGLVEDPSIPRGQPWEGVVARKKVTLYTAIQAGCLYAMFAVKSNPVIGVLFPLIIALLGPLAWGLKASGLFSEKEMAALDADDP